MYKILTASNDSYITNKYVKTLRATDANMGAAGTLDLFKLYGESNISSFDLTVNDYNKDTNGDGIADTAVELSRLLIKFDLDPVRYIHQNKCSVNHPSFSATLQLFDIYGGQTTPSGFNISVYPLSQSFDEGKGRDVVRYSDLGSCNFITASINNGQINEWFSPGADEKGQLNDENIDIIETDLENNPLYVTQYFETGKENLFVDVTNIISGTIKEDIPDHGFRISFSQSEEQDTKTYFVKRFSSRNSNDPTIRPRLIIKYDDTIQDSHKSMNFNISGSLFLNNFVNYQYSNILSGSTDNPGTFDEISGDDCIKLKIFTGSYEKSVIGSSYSLGDIQYPGIYSASFLIDKFDENLINHINASGSITFTTVWTDNDEKTLYHSGSFTILNSNTTSFQNSNSRLIVSITNLKKEYYKNSIARFRVFVDNVGKTIPYVKIPREKQSEIFYNMKYSVIDVDTGKEIIPFQLNDRSTTLSIDSDGMYFDIDMSSLPPKRVYKIQFLLREMGEDTIFQNVASKFRVI